MLYMSLNKNKYPSLRPNSVSAFSFQPEICQPIFKIIFWIINNYFSSCFLYTYIFHTQ